MDNFNLKKYLAENKLGENQEENNGPHADLGFDPEQKDPAEHIRVLAKELRNALKTENWSDVSGVADDLEYLTHPDKFPSTWIKAENDLTENKGLDLAKDVISKAREAMKKLTDEEVEAFRKEVANAFDLK